MYTTDLMGLTLDNPVIIAPGPWSRGEKLKDALQCKPELSSPKASSANPIPIPARATPTATTTGGSRTSGFTALWNSKNGSTS